MLVTLRRRVAMTLTLLGDKRRPRRSAGQRGAVLVEAAIALPMMTLLMFGILEYGLLFGDGMDLASAMRAGVRTAASMPNNTSATDYAILQQVKTTSGRVSGQITNIVIYKADAAGGAPTDACKQGHPQVGICNVYTQADLSMSQSELAESGDSSAWLPDARVPGTDYVGVWASAQHTWVTGFVGPAKTVNDEAVMRVQPSPSLGAETADDTYDGLAPISTLLPTSSTSSTSTTSKVSGSTSTTVKVKKTTTTTIPGNTTTTFKATTTTRPKTTTTQAPTTTTKPGPTTTTVKKVKPTTTTTTPPPIPPPSF